MTAGTLGITATLLGEEVGESVGSALLGGLVKTTEQTKQKQDLAQSLARYPNESASQLIPPSTKFDTKARPFPK